MIRRRHYIGFLSCLFVLGTHSASAAPRKAALPELLKQVENKYSKEKTLFAEFEQVNHIASLDRIKKSSGLIWVKKPGRLRWETRSPDPNILVSDGKTFWFYTPPFSSEDNGQVIIRKSAEVQSQLASALLSGSFSMTKDVSYKEKTKGVFLLTPEAGTAGDVVQAEIHVHPRSKVIEKVNLKYRSGNTSEIKLNRIELGKKLSDTFFRFQAPPKTERIVQ